MLGIFEMYNSLPSTIEAVQFTDEYKDRIFHSLSGNAFADFEDGKPILKVTSIHGDTAIVRLGDWIVKDAVLGTYYPVKHDIFIAKYVKQIYGKEA